MKNKPKAIPIAYFITFTCYGARLHCGNQATVDKKHNIIGTPFLLENKIRFDSAKEKMIEPEYFLDQPRRDIVLKSIIETCKYFNWRLFAAHVRSNHVHLVLESDREDSIILHKIKSYATMALKNAGFDVERKKRWTRHASTRYVWKAEELSMVLFYVVDGQGEPMSVFQQHMWV